MKIYELTYLISSELSETEAKNLQEKIASLTKEEGGILIEGGIPFLKRIKLAYPITNKTTRQKQTEAYLAVLAFQSNPEKIANLEKKLKSENQIIRYLLLTKLPLKEVTRRRREVRTEIISEKPAIEPEEKKVELKEIEKKLEEILKE